MTQEEKELLKKDLCARLPYRVKCNVDDRGVNIIGTLNSYTPLTDGSKLFGLSNKVYDAPDKYWQPKAKFHVEEIKPYLRPMSSMTDEERKEYDEWHLELESGRIKDWKNADYIDWLNAHHFDYRGLIEKGLALKATEDMYGKIVSKRL